MSLKTFVELVVDYPHLRLCHVSYIVNINHVDCYSYYRPLLSTFHKFSLFINSFPLSALNRKHIIINNSNFGSAGSSVPGADNY